MTMTSKEYGKIISKNLKRIAYESQKTQADMVRDLNVKQATISSWMNGTRIPRMDKIDLLCQYFNCSRADIMEPHDDLWEPPKPEYYTDPETARLAREMYEDPEMRALFHMKRNMDPAVFTASTSVVKELYYREHPEDADDYTGS